MFTTFPLPLKYRKYIDIFSESEVRQLPDHILVEHIINTKNIKSLYKPIYNLLVNEFSIFRDNLEKLLKKRYIQRLISPAGTPILFISIKK